MRNLTSKELETLKQKFSSGKDRQNIAWSLNIDLNTAKSLINAVKTLNDDSILDLEFNLPSD
jgi:DNA-binding CsgD family transcriptional regulator